MGTISRRFCVALLAGFLVALVAACGGEDQPQGFDPGPLGAVEVGDGGTVHIRSLLSHSVAPGLAEGSRYGIELAVRDFGDIQGHDIVLGQPMDSMCGPEGGRMGAEQIIADPRVVGVIGTSCSGAAVAASPQLSEAGLVMVAPSNTSPALTSDLAGSAGSDYHPGYFRISNNDLYQAAAIADFAYNELQLRRMAAIDDGDPYTTALVSAFANAFRAAGGDIASLARIEKGDTDTTDVLADFSAAEPDGIFFPLFRVEGAPFAEQAQATEGLENVALISGAALFVTEFLALPQSMGVYFAGPETVQGANVNEATGRSAEEVLDAFAATYGSAPGTPYWAHAYDATTLLLSAIESVAEVAGGGLFIDRAALREEVGATEGFEGLVGTLTCDEFGDCGTGRVNIYHHTNPAFTDPADLEVVYEFVP